MDKFNLIDIESRIWKLNNRNRQKSLQMLYVMYVTNQRNCSLEIYPHIGVIAPRMMVKNMSYSYMKNVSFMP